MTGCASHCASWCRRNAPALRWLLLLLAVAPGPAGRAGGEEVAVVYNLDGGPDSQRIATHYARRRNVPTNQVIGLHLPTGEAFSRKEYEERLARPLLDQFQDRGLILFQSRIIPVSEGQACRVVREPVASRIRYTVLCYGVPNRILEDKTGSRAGLDLKAHPELRTEAAVDSELALLPWCERPIPIEGVIKNPFARAEAPGEIGPAGGVLMVTRLDGPSAAIALRLVDLALAAETNGLNGRAYFDLRGLTNGPYASGDEWLRQAADAARRQGYEMVVDQRPGTFTAGTPLSALALYAGWYDSAPTGPFKLGRAEFAPGAIAYHLYSYSARSLRTTNTWVGGLLDQGAAVTIGYVNEPYLEYTVDVGVWYRLMLEKGATFGEAAYAALPALSWQATVIGDPLYRPGGRRLLQLDEELARRRDPAQAWIRLRRLNQQLVHGLAPGPAAAGLQADSLTATSAVLTEKLAALREEGADLAGALAATDAALALQPSPRQRERLELDRARRLAVLKRAPEAVEALEQFLRDHPDYPEPLPLLRQIVSLARPIGRNASLERAQTEIDRLTPGRPTTNAPSPSRTP